MITWVQTLDWIETHPLLFTAIAWPIITGAVNWTLKARTAEEYAALPKAVSWALLAVRHTGLDARPVLAMLWKSLTRNKAAQPVDNNEKE